MLTSQERRKKEDKDDRVSPKEYQLAKKRNKKLSQIRGQTPKQKTKQPPKKKQKTEEQPRTPKKNKQPGNFKSKKRHKRR